MGFFLPVREDLVGLEPYGAPQLDMSARLNVNKNPYTPSPGVTADITRSVAKAAPTLNRYPDRDFTELCYALADYLGVEPGIRRAPELIQTANGSNEIMTQILQAFEGPGHTLVSFAPTYSMHHRYACDTNTTWVQGRRLDDSFLDLDTVARVLTRERSAVLALVSPNNPTSTALPQEQQWAIMETTRESRPIISGYPSATLVVIDKAYGEFRRKGVFFVLELLEDVPHLVVTRTTSRAFGMASLRLSYMSIAREIIDAVMLTRLSHHLSALTQTAALAALYHKDSFMAQVGVSHKECDGLVDWLRTYGSHTLDSNASFVLLGTFEDRTAIFEALLARGVLIRVVDPEGRLCVSVGIPEEICLFTTAPGEITR